MVGSGHPSEKKNGLSAVLDKSVGSMTPPTPRSPEVSDLREGCMQRKEPGRVKRGQKRLHRVEGQPGLSSGGHQSEHQGKIIPGAGGAEAKAWWHERQWHFSGMMSKCRGTT